MQDRFFVWVSPVDQAFFWVLCVAVIGLSFLWCFAAGWFLVVFDVTEIGFGFDKGSHAMGS